MSCAIVHGSLRPHRLPQRGHVGVVFHLCGQRALSRLSGIAKGLRQSGVTPRPANKSKSRESPWLDSRSALTRDEARSAWLQRRIPTPGLDTTANATAQARISKVDEGHLRLENIHDDIATREVAFPFRPSSQTPKPRSHGEVTDTRGAMLNCEANSDFYHIAAVNPVALTAENSETPASTRLQDMLFHAVDRAKENDWEKTPKQRDSTAKGLVHSMPTAISYSTAASKLIFGARSVLAALKANKRKFYKLYEIQYSDGILESVEPAIAQIRKIAIAAGIPIASVSRSYFDRLIRTVDAITQTHLINDICLEASPPRMIPVESLGFFSGVGQYFHIDIGAQSKEDQEINGKPDRLKYTSSGWRRPFLTWIHGVTDARNLGAIARNVLYFGVDGLMITSRATATPSPVTSRTSAGSSEFVEFLSVTNPEKFIQESQSNGWQFYAAVAPSDRGEYRLLEDIPISPLVKAPCVLILGNEETGLPPWLTKLADQRVAVGGLSPQAMEASLDSLNVSVAGGLLMSRFLRVPTPSERHAAQEQAMAAAQANEQADPDRLF